ncbi:hypothetical protein [Flavobacterium sp. NKUCC04_CG]|uniref:hypothetical protein n=1 Tax=Flavobacterium sp. NKUCC04_CG TaxID=2842121 RepID=UPI001C5BD478|nr:hypothetical protein [Flavobacterium sp. NKUCC04_CG]MBW3519573.1 hypothetical protein [Flavobacterium sp. NKUCC04_CG]
MKTIVIGRVKPSIDVVKRLVDELGTTVGYLLGESAQINILKNPEMLHRLNEIDDLPEEVNAHILYAIDGLVRDAKTRKSYSK